MTYEDMEYDLNCVNGGRWSLASVGFALLAVVLFALAGCRGTGTYAYVGDVTAPVEVSDSSDTINVRALFSMRGAKVWSAKDSIVAMTYTNDYTNSYLYGMVETRGRQNFGVNVNPCEVASGKGDEAKDKKPNSK